MSGGPEFDPESHSTSPDNFRPVVWLVLLSGAIVRLYLLRAAPSTHEDFYITLRYAENIAAGKGFAYNAGHHVLGTTTPLYTLILALVARLGMNATLCGKLLGIAADAITGLFTYRLGRAIGRPAAGLAAVVCLAFAPVNLTWATKGMEVGIVAAAVGASWAAWAERREVPAWIAAAVLVLLRIDGAALAAVMLVATLFRDRRVPWRGLGVFALLVLPWAVFATAYFGSPIPLSATAKLIVYSRMIPGRFPQLGLFLIAMLHNGFGKLVVAGCLLYLVCVSWRITRKGANQSGGRHDKLLIAPLVWVGIYYGSMALSHVVLFGWYYEPPTPVYYLAAMTGFELAAEIAGLHTARAKVQRIALAACVGSVLLAVLTVPRVVVSLKRDQSVETDLRIPIGIWMREHAGPRDTLMLEPIGYIGYYSRMTIIDEIGLVSPEALPSYAQGVPCAEHDLWERLQPNWILLRMGELNRLRACEEALPATRKLNAEYTPVKSWQDPVNPRGQPAFILYMRPRLQNRAR